MDDPDYVAVCGCTFSSWLAVFFIYWHDKTAKSALEILFSVGKKFVGLIVFFWLFILAFAYVGHAIYFSGHSSTIEVSGNTAYEGLEKIICKE